MDRGQKYSRLLRGKLVNVCFAVTVSKWNHPLKYDVYGLNGVKVFEQEWL